MSGIAGLVFGDGREPDAVLAGNMVSAAAWPGDDGVAVWREGPAALIRFRHATTPEAAEETQPQRGASGALICFDGRLDNRSALLVSLGNVGTPLKDAPDAALALALYERRGMDALALLAGDYAFAIWHPDARSLFCVRSPIGWRPFHWTFDGRRFAFASDPRMLVAGLGLDRSVNEGLAAELLSNRIVSATETLWRDVHRLEQGCALTFERGQVGIRRWHDPRGEDLSHLSDRDHVDRFNELFDQALVSVMRSSMPVVSHLSGGLDSSAIVCRATELHRRGAVNRQVAAVSVRYPGEPQDESDWCAAVEQHLGITARIAADRPFDPDAARQWCATTLQLPMRPNAMGPTLSVCAAMRERGERVLLTGEGGDDWLNGSHAHWPDLLLGGQLLRLLRETSSPGTERNLRGVASQILGPIFSARRRRALSYPSVPLDGGVPAWIRPEWAGEAGLRDRWESAPLPDLPSFAQRHRQAMIAAPQRQIVFDSVQACAAQHGVELRHPFHDIRLVRFLMGARGDMLRRGAVRKHLLREAMRGTLPEAVRTRRSKAQFAAPIVDALATFFAQRPPEEMAVVRRGWIDGTVLGTLFAQQRQWRTGGMAGAPPNGALGGLWAAMALELWLEAVSAH